METSEQDITAEWALPDAARPPSIRELEARIEEAVATARASESAVMTVGAAALDAAEQAKRAAELAERASASAASAAERTATPAPPRAAGAAGFPLSAPGRSGAAAARRAEGSRRDEDLSLLDFNERADRLAARLKQLQEPLPLDRDGRPASRPVAGGGQ